MSATVVADINKAESDGYTPLILPCYDLILACEICKENHETNTMEDGYSSAHTARLINTSQQIMSGILQREPLGINTHASSIKINHGVWYGIFLTTSKNVPSTITDRMNNTYHLYVFVPQVNIVTSVKYHKLLFLECSFHKCLLHNTTVI